MDQDRLVKYLNWARNRAWDIPSALMVICSTPPPQDGLDPYLGFPMHRSSYWPEADPFWKVLDDHFRQVHSLDLSDPRIDWNFDT
jgi:hypothetical protein